MKNPEKATVLVEKMLDFAQVHGLMEAEDRCYTRNLLLDALGMAAPETTGVITLDKDVVATDESGALSLSKSVAIAAGSEA